MEQIKIQHEGKEFSYELSSLVGKLGYCISSTAAMDYLESKGVKFYKEQYQV